MKIAAAFDHRGVHLRAAVLAALEGHDVVDLGVDTDAQRVDYPDTAREVGEALRAGDAERGVLVCGSGVGAAVAACKLPGIRAAICHDVYSAHQGVEHDDMNVLCLGSDVVGPELAAELIRAFLDELTDPKEIFLHLTRDDVSDACDLLRRVWDEGKGQDGYVSWEVDPNLAYDRDATFEEAKRLHSLVEKPNLHVKIPATEPGLGAIEDMIALGRNINVTLIFSLGRHREVMEAYIRGLERLVESGGDPSKVASVASFFVSRVDTEADKRLDAIGREDLKGKLAVANAKLAYQNYKEVFSGARWEALAAEGATRQRCLWASTSVKNPDYRDTMYVEELIGPETVNTMPQETIEAFQDHGKVEANTVERDIDG